MLSMRCEPATAPVPSRHLLFQRVVQPHLKEAHRLARHLAGCAADADDIIQETSVRLLRFLHTYRGGDARSWVLSVARNSAFSWLRTNRRAEALTVLQAAVHTQEPYVLLDEAPALNALYAFGREEGLHLTVEDADGNALGTIASPYGATVLTVGSRHWTLRSDKPG